MEQIWFTRLRLELLIPFTLLLVVALSNAQDNFYFNKQPQNINVVSGQSALLECNVSNTKDIRFYWTLNGDILENTTRRYQNGSNLHITRVDKTFDQGEFKCIAMNVSYGFSLASLGASLNILWIDNHASVELQSPPTPADVVEGANLTLRCKVEGSLRINYEWYKNSVRLFESERIHIRNKRITIFGINAWDNGVYTCRASNEAGGVDSLENFPLVIPSDIAARIVVMPKDMTVRRNDSARFDCVYENAAITEWYVRDEGPLTNNSRMAIFLNGSLIFYRVKKQDEGLYKCVGIRGISKDEPGQTYIAMLRIAVLQDLNGNSFEPKINPNQISVVPLHNKFEITCKKPDGHPVPEVRWIDPNGNVIGTSWPIHVDGTRLIIDSVQESHSGNYTCIAENMAGKKSDNINLQVSIPPSIQQDPVNQVVDEGKATWFHCTYKGSRYPITTVHWLKDENLIKEDSRHFHVDHDSGQLNIDNVLLSDSGRYACIINTTGFPVARSKSAELFVKEKLKFLPVPVNKKLELGSDTKIPCKATGAVKPVVKWIKEGHPYFEWPNHISDENGTLYFYGVQMSDAGKYTCIATSAQDIINATISVDVIVTPKFIVKPSDTVGFEGFSTIINCKAYGDPQPTIQWDKNSVLGGFDQSRFRVMENGSLFISEIHMEDAGKYGCTAGNSGGFKREEVNLRVESGEYVGFPGNRDSAGAKRQKEEDSVMTNTVIITLSCAAGYMVLVLGLMIYCGQRRRRQKARRKLEEINEEAKQENGDLLKKRELTEKEPSYKDYKDNVKSDNDAQSHTSSGHSQHSKRRASCDRFQFPRHDLHSLALLGKGDFGDVFLARAHGIRDGEQETVVLVKALHSRDENVHFEFKRELDMYSKLNHPHIARLLGVCKEVEPLFMIMEYADWGDLKQLLLATRKNSGRNPHAPPLTLAQMVTMCNQIALGMEYLSNHRYTHKDLAARNCLIQSTFDVKISNSSLSHDTYSREYHQHNQSLIPLRWMPPEAVFDDDFSTKSDVWAFGVFVWEVFMQGELPFSDKNDDVVIRELKESSLQLLFPEHCPQQLQELVAKCMAPSPKDRPSFSEIAVSIGDLTIDSDV